MIAVELERSLGASMTIWLRAYNIATIVIALKTTGYNRLPVISNPLFYMQFELKSRYKCRKRLPYVNVQALLAGSMYYQGK